MLITLLRRYLRPYRKDIGIIVVLQLIGVIASLYLPSLNADIIDKGVAVGDTGYVLSAGMLMLGVSIIQIVATIAAVFFGARVAMKFGRDVRAAVFHQVGTFSDRELGQFGAPSLITRSTNDVQQVQMLVMMTFTMLVSAPIMCVGGVVMALREDVGLSWLLLVSVPALVLAVSLVIRKMVPQFRVMQVRVDNLNRVLREQITGIRVVRAFVREDREEARLGVANADVTATATKVGRLQATLFPVVMLVFNASSVAVIWFGGHRVDAGQMQVGALMAFLSYLMQILMAAMMAAFLGILVPRASVCADRIAEVLDTETSVGEPVSPKPARISNGLLTFADVDFGYPGAAAPVLCGLNFTATPGKVTAIIGSTGSGKSTLISLIPRLFDATGGTVSVDGDDVRETDLDGLRTQIGLVPQKPYLFSGTIASNLRYGDPHATDDELWQALRVAQAADFVSQMTDGLDSPIAQGGTNVSGGQRQRLAIARALVAKPAIYLFDDSFSALDLTTDARLRAALRPQTADATVVIVAQRVSTIADADQIIVLEDGRIVGIGTHQELQETCPTYLEIVQSQLTAQAAA